MIKNTLERSVSEEKRTPLEGTQWFVAIPSQARSNRIIVRIDTGCQRKKRTGIGRASFVINSEKRNFNTQAPAYCRPGHSYRRA
jgi:hypothetical protein